MKHLRKHLSVANVLSCIALFVALSGAAFAATAMLPNKSVKTRHLAKGVVTTQKLRNGAVTAAKLRNGAVIGSKIAAGAVGSSQLADGGVRSADLGGGVVTTAKLKDGAVTAAKLSTGFNAQLVKNVSYASKTSPAVFPSDSAKVTADCPTGRKVIGGGARINGTVTNVVLVESGPTGDSTTASLPGWTAAATEFKEEAADWTLTVTAVCAEF